MDYIPVYCDYLARIGEDPITFARQLGTQQFCDACGETNHTPLAGRG